MTGISWTPSSRQATSCRLQVSSCRLPDSIQSASHQLPTACPPPKLYSMFREPDKPMIGASSSSSRRASANGKGIYEYSSRQTRTGTEAQAVLPLMFLCPRLRSRHRTYRIVMDERVVLIGPSAARVAGATEPLTTPAASNSTQQDSTLEPRYCNMRHRLLW